MGGSSNAEVDQDNLLPIAYQIIQLDITVDEAQHVKVIQEEDSVAEDNFSEILTPVRCWGFLLVQLYNRQVKQNEV